MTTLNYLPETASQTAGPYVHIGLIPHQAGFDIFEKPFSNILGGEGERIRIEGRVLDGLGVAVPRCVARNLAGGCGRDSTAIRRTRRTKRWIPGFRGWGRTGTDFETGVWWFETIKPGPVDRAAWAQEDGAACQRLAGVARHQHRVCRRGYISATRPR